jgi:predicted DNA-binding transcriptional regulator YafY
MLETSARLLRVLALLQSRRDWTGAALADRLDVTTRTVRSDIDRLRRLGYRVRSTSGSAGGYRLEAGNTMPPLLLDDEETVAVAVSLRAAASGSVAGAAEASLRALAKLEQTVPSRLRRRIDMLRETTASAAGPGPTVDAETLTAIAEAAYRHEQLRFDYLDRAGGETRRRAEPHRLVYTGRRWYLLAWDVDRDDWRTYRADRIRPRVPNGPSFTPKRPPEEAVAHVLRGLGQTAWRYRASVSMLPSRRRPNCCRPAAACSKPRATARPCGAPAATPCETSRTTSARSSCRSPSRARRNCATTCEPSPHAMRPRSAMTGRRPPGPVDGFRAGRLRAFYGPVA